MSCLVPECADHVELCSTHCSQAVDFFEISNSPFHSFSIFVTQVQQDLVIVVTNVDESPVSATFRDTGGQLTFADDQPKVRETSPVGTVIGLIEAEDMVSVGSYQTTGNMPC